MGTAALGGTDAQRAVADALHQVEQLGAAQVAAVLEIAADGGLTMY